MSQCQSLQEHPEARRYVKIATVLVEFAESPGILGTLEGPVPYDRGDALLTGVKGERWPVRRDRFDSMYERVPDSSSRWRKQVNHPVLAIQIQDVTEVRNGAAQFSGQPGDWLVEYGPGDQAIVANDIFLKSYREVTRQ